MVAIVEKSAVPLIVSALAATMEVMVIGTIKLVDAIEHVLGSVAVNNIEEHGNSEAVSGINELLEVLGSTISTASSEEVVDLIAKAGIVRMFHHSHQLNHIVT